MTARRRRVGQSRPCSCQARSSLPKEHRAWLRSRESGTRDNAGRFARRLGTVMDRWRAPRPPSWRARLLGFSSPNTPAVLIVEIDLTRIDPVSRTLPFGSDPARSAPLRVAALRTAQTMAAEKTDHIRTEFPLCMGSIPLRSSSSGLQRRTWRFQILRMLWTAGAWTPRD